METSLTVAHKSALPIASMNDIAQMGNFLAQSQMFGAKTQAEGIMIVGICQQERWSYADFMANFDIIKGKISKKPVAMLADFKASGGSCTIKKRDPEGSIIELRRGKEKAEFSCLWADAQKEAFPYLGKEEDVLREMAAGGKKLVLKPKYVSSRSRMQMLWARCVGDAIRAFAPECCKGIYTPEETDDFTEAPVAPPATPVSGTKGISPEVQGVASVSPLVEPEPDPAVCPSGSLQGRRWDSMPNNWLALALSQPFPEACKNYIRDLLDERTQAARNAVENAEAKIQEVEND